MVWTAMTKPAQGTSTKKIDIDTVIDNQTHLYNIAGGAGSGAGGILQNGSFENDVDADGIPDGWDLTLYTAGSAAFDTTTPAHGAQAYKFTSSGTGGGYITSTDYIVCSSNHFLFVDFILKSSVADIHNLVELLFYDKDKAYISTSTIYDEDTTNPTSWQRFILGITPVATAMFCKLRLTGAKSDDATSGSCSFDGVSLYTIGSTCQTWAPAIAETSTNQATWTDCGSVTLRLPTLGHVLSKMTLTFIAQIKSTDVGYTTEQRFAIGTLYSNEATTTSVTYVENRFTLEYVGTGGEVTFKQQLQTSSGTTSAYGKLIVTNVFIQLILK